MSIFACLLRDSGQGMMSETEAVSVVCAHVCVDYMGNKGRERAQLNFSDMAMAWIVINTNAIDPEHSF